MKSKPANTDNTTLGETSEGVDSKIGPLSWKLRVVYAGKAEGIHNEELRWPECQPLSIGRRNLGSAKEAGLQLADERVSREHARIFQSAHGVMVLDLSSRNGSARNGIRLVAGTPQPLADGDVLQFGDSFVVIRHEPANVQDVKIDSVIGISRAACLLRCAIARSALRERTVLILGESGTGKEVTAQAYHAFSRRSGAFVAVNCAAIPSSLAEAQLFGVARGVFTGAVEQNGLLAAADGGTLFLDEIGELPLEIQPKLLRVLENRQIVPVGSQRSTFSSARIIAATNRDLRQAMHAKTFREDLYARLTQEQIELPPLRTRREDILLLAQRFAGADFSPSSRVVSALLNYSWPLNIRELGNVVGRLADRSEEEVLNTLISHHAPQEAGTAPPPRWQSGNPIPSSEQIAALLEQHQGNLSRIEKLHGYSRRQFQRWIQSYGLDLTRYRQSGSK